MILFSLLYTSRRPKAIHGCLKQWIDGCKDKWALEIVLSCDEGDTATFAAMEAEAKLIRETSPVSVIGPIFAPIPGTCVKGWNACAVASTGKVLVAISDDFSPCTGHWDEQLKAVAADGWMDADVMVIVSDGCLNEGQLMATLPILTHKRYARFGYFFYPGYQSMFTDNDVTARAAMDGCLVDARKLVFQHNHHVNQKRAKDEVDAQHDNSTRMEQGRILFQHRQQHGFPIDMGPKAAQYVSYGQEQLRFVAYLQVVRDDFSLLEVCLRLIEEGVKDFFFCIPNEYWDGTPTPPEHVAEVTAVIEKLRERNDLNRITEFIPDVSKYRVDTTDRIEVETRVRNSSLRTMNEIGYGHILIVDGDELWRPGLLKDLTKLIMEHNPPYVAVHGIPVIGCPGYPIEGATDWIGIYIRGDNRFTVCRAAFSSLGFTLEGYPVIHFSAVRRTYEELAAKMRASGHNGDPKYDFEGWLRNTLPSLHIGMKDVHMYDDGVAPNIWPTVAAWDQSTFSDIPDSLKQYLCTDIKEPRPELRDAATASVFREVDELMC